MSILKHFLKISHSAIWNCKAFFMPRFLKLIFCIGLLGCSVSDTPQNGDIAFVTAQIEKDNLITLMGKSVGPVNYFNDIVSINYDDDHFLVYDEKNEAYFHMLNAQLSPMKKYGKPGEGPGEISFEPTIVHQNFDQNGYFSYFNFAKSALFIIPLDSLDQPNFEPNKVYVSPPEIMDCQSMLFINDSLMIGSGGSRSGKLFFWNPLTDSIKFTDFIPNMKLPSQRDIGYLYDGVIAYYEPKETVVFSSNYFNQIEFYNLQGELGTVIQLGEPKLPIFYKDNKITSDETVTYVLDLVVNKKGIFALYLGKASIEYKDDISILRPHILHFDWQGQLINEYELDRPVNNITVDENNLILYALDLLYEEQPIVKYELME